MKNLCNSVLIGFLLTSLFVMPIRSMEPTEITQKARKIYAVPGIAGRPVCDPPYVRGLFKATRDDMSVVESPSFPLIDLGQSQCMALLSKELSGASEQEDILLHGNSQGGGTVLNWLAQDKGQSKKIKIAVLEAPLISGNSAINAHIKSFNASLAALPGASCLFPWAAKLIFPFYSPSGD